MLAEHALHHVGLRRPSFSLAHAEAWTCWCSPRCIEDGVQCEATSCSSVSGLGDSHISCADCGWESPGWILDSPKMMPTRREQRGVRHAVRLCVAAHRAGRGSRPFQSSSARCEVTAAGLVASRRRRILRQCVMGDVMSHEAGIWIDHKKAVIVNISEGHVSTKTLISAVGPHPHYAGSQERWRGEKV